MNGYKIHIIAFLILLVSFSFSLKGQNIKEPKINKYKNEKLANRCINDGNYYAAIELYQKLAVAEPESACFAYQLAELYFFVRDYKNAEKWYKETLEKDKNTGKFQMAGFRYASTLKMNGKYNEAINEFNEFKNSYHGSEASEHKNRVKKEISDCQFALNANKENDSIMLIRLQTNNANQDFAPVPYGEDGLIYSSLPVNRLAVINRRDNENPGFIKLYYAAKKGNDDFICQGEFEGPFNIDNMHTANGAFSPGKTRFYFTRCKSSMNNNMLCSIFVSELKDNIWQEPVMLGAEVNCPEFTATHPNVGIRKTRGAGSRDEEILYFVSDRPGGLGGYDIWYSVISNGTEYSPARNLGSAVNTGGNEVTPFYDAETQILYFSSDGWQSFGGLDIFKSEWTKSKFENPENIGYPSNSSVDDFYFVLSGKKGEGYLVSNRPGGNSQIGETCCDDIYRFRPVFNLQKKDSLIINGVVLQSDTTAKQTDSTAVSLIDKTEKIPAEQIKNIEEDKTYALTNIYFEFDKSDLMPESKTELDNLVTLLINMPDAIVEIAAHTDSTGSDSYNMELSLKRAESVVNYLISVGINSKRLVAKGYGETRPIAGSTAPDKSGNPEVCRFSRRVEFKIIGVLDKGENSKNQTPNNE